MTGLRQRMSFSRALKGKLLETSSTPKLAYTCVHACSNAKSERERKSVEGRFAELHNACIVLNTADYCQVTAVEVKQHNHDTASTLADGSSMGVMDSWRRRSRRRSVTIFGNRFPSNLSGISSSGNTLHPEDCYLSVCWEAAHSLIAEILIWMYLFSVSYHPRSLSF